MKPQDVQITIEVGSEVFQAKLYDNPTSKSLIAQMPFTVELKDYAGIEKIFYPEEKLSLEGAPKGADPKIGDIMCYGPWGNVVFFYGDFSFASGLVPMGHIQGIDALVKALDSNQGKAIFKQE